MTKYYNQLCLLAAVLLACVIGVNASYKCIQSDVLEKVSDITTNRTAAACTPSASNCGLLFSSSEFGNLTVKFICGDCSNTSIPRGMRCKDCRKPEDGCNRHDSPDDKIKNVLMDRPKCYSYRGDFDEKINISDKVYCGYGAKCGYSAYWEPGKGKEKASAFHGCQDDCYAAVNGGYFTYGKVAKCTLCPNSTCTGKVIKPPELSDKALTTKATKATTTPPIIPANKGNDSKTTSKPGGGKGGDDSTTAGAAAVSPSHLALTASSLLVLAGAANY